MGNIRIPIEVNNIYHIFNNVVAKEYLFKTDLRDWKFSSYERLFSASASKLQRWKVIEWFDNLDDFAAFHQKGIDSKMVVDLEFC
jgi:hypothetical protein